MVGFDEPFHLGSFLVMFELHTHFDPYFMITIMSHSCIKRAPRYSSGNTVKVRIAVILPLSG
jgi:hypothetical protein